MKLSNKKDIDNPFNEQFIFLYIYIYNKIFLNIIN